MASVAQVAARTQLAIESINESIVKLAEDNGLETPVVPKVHRFKDMLQLVQLETIADFLSALSGTDEPEPEPEPEPKVGWEVSGPAQALMDENGLKPSDIAPEGSKINIDGVRAFLATMGIDDEEPEE